MVESRMTVADVVAGVLAGEHGDFVREAVALIARELMEGEISGEIGAGLAKSVPAGSRIATGIARGRGRPGSASSSC
jgi:hypothetical protein